MTELTMTTETHPQIQTTPAPAASGEYPLSTLCLRLDVGGVALSWTLRGDDADVASRLPRILDYIKRLQAKLPKPEAPPCRGTGQALDRGPGQARPVAVPSAPLEEREDYCAIHGIAMVQQSNERGSWWSHRLPEGGYCKGKRRKAGA